MGIEDLPDCSSGQIGYMSEKQVRAQGLSALKAITNGGFAQYHGRNTMLLAKESQRSWAELLKKSWKAAIKKGIVKCNSCKCKTVTVIFKVDSVGRSDFGFRFNDFFKFYKPDKRNKIFGSTYYNKYKYDKKTGIDGPMYPMKGKNNKVTLDCALIKKLGTKMSQFKDEFDK